MVLPGRVGETIRSPPNSSFWKRQQGLRGGFWPGEARQDNAGSQGWRWDELPAPGVHGPITLQPYGPITL